MDMEFIKCEKEHFCSVAKMYESSVEFLENNINYPLWSSEHPSREYVKEAIAKGEQFACIDCGSVIGAVVLSENPEGSYELGDWSRELSRGEYLVVHILAVSPERMKEGVGEFLVDGCISYAKSRGYKAIRLDVVPDNIPAIRLYEKKGFCYAGTKDLQRGIEEIPIFGLYELNL
jgi:ribosomal protein S18 acetylase RimI-like enzyme